MHCPLNGPRDIHEFVCGGEAYTPLDQSIPNAALMRYLFVKQNILGHVFEWWYHRPSAYWFVAERDTATGEVVRTMTSQRFKELLNRS